MKNQTLKKYFAPLFVVLISQSVFAKPLKVAQEDWAQIFATEIGKSLANLGQQCAITSDVDYKTYKKAHDTDEDLDMTNAEFVAQLQSVGIPVDGYNITQYYENKSICYLTQNEFLAISLYTGSYYQQINAALRNLNLPRLKDYKYLIKFMLSGLNKLENYVGVTKRGTSLKSELILNCEAGAAFADRGFMSTSIAGGFGGQYRFILASQSCKYIAPFSRFPNEEEVLCLPGTVFQIRYLNQGPAGKEVILQEAGQRFDLDDLIKTLEEHPEAQNPTPDSYWAQSCQSGEKIFETEEK